MADKLAGTYRYVKKDGDSVSRVILQAGDDVPKDLDKDERDQLKKDGLIVDAKRLNDDGLRLPYGHPDSDSGDDEVEAQEQEAGTAKKQTASGNKGS